ncbi:hypothetical protein BX667DRAFT_501669 [Coemansia mojavensis]|nr:hypothetical protein BX667DRAFT_501669 [Coemansia mojavensis]
METSAEATASSDGPHKLLGLKANTAQTAIMSIVFAAWVLFAVILGILIARKRAAAQHRAETPDMEQRIDPLVLSARRTKCQHTRLNKNELDQIPVQIYHEYKQTDDEMACVICLDKFNGDSLVRPLSCNHVFHSDCIDKWLLKRSCRCPLCNADSRGAMNLPQRPSKAKLAN